MPDRYLQCAFLHMACSLSKMLHACRTCMEASTGTRSSLYARGHQGMLRACSTPPAMLARFFSISPSAKTHCLPLDCGLRC